VGRSRGGLTTKIHLLADTLGRPLKLILTPGQAADIKSAPALLDGVTAAGIIADKGYDSNAFRQLAADAGMEAIIPSNRSRKVLIPHDAEVYKIRNRIERCFNKLKHYRRVATRFDRLDCHYLAFLHLASAMLWLR
jgi:transposase